MPEQLCVWEGGLLHLSDPPMGLQQAPPQTIWLAGDVTEQGDTQAPEQVLDAARSASTLAAEGSPDTAEEQPGQVSPQAAGYVCAGAAHRHGSQCGSCISRPTRAASCAMDLRQHAKGRAPCHQDPVSQMPLSSMHGAELAAWS